MGVEREESLNLLVFRRQINNFTKIFLRKSSKSITAIYSFAIVFPEQTARSGEVQEQLLQDAKIYANDMATVIKSDSIDTGSLPDQKVHITPTDIIMMGFLIANAKAVEKDVVV